MGVDPSPRRLGGRGAAAACCVVLLVARSAAQDVIGAPHGHAAKSALNAAAARDPLATEDSYAKLSARDKEYWVRHRPRQIVSQFHERRME